MNKKCAYDHGEYFEKQTYNASPQQVIRERGIHPHRTHRYLPESTRPHREDASKLGVQLVAPVPLLQLGDAGQALALHHLQARLLHALPPQALEVVQLSDLQTHLPENILFEFKHFLHLKLYCYLQFLCLKQYPKVQI